MYWIKVAFRWAAIIVLVSLWIYLYSTSPWRSVGCYASLFCLPWAGAVLYSAELKLGLTRALIWITVAVAIAIPGLEIVLRHDQLGSGAYWAGGAILALAGAAALRADGLLGSK
jgi:hypothetical protein